MFRSKRTLLFLGITALLLPPFFAGAQDVSRVSLEELRSMMEKGEPVVVVDNRPPAQYDQQHIKGAVSLPWEKDVGEKAQEILPKDKLIVTYCDCGPGESDSADVANQLILSGFDRVKVLANGWTPWLQAGYPVEKGGR